MKSYLEFILCSVCRRDYLVSTPSNASTSTAGAPLTVPVPFYVSTCYHEICHRCLFGTNPAPNPLDKVKLPCPACQTVTPLALLVTNDPTNELAPFFADVSESIDLAKMGVQHQISSLMNQVDYFKPKCSDQKKTISRLIAEVKKLKAVKNENEALRSQIASMQAQGSPQAQTSVPAHHHHQQVRDQQQQYYSDQNTNYAQTAQPDPRYSRTSPVQIYSDETPRSHKRRAVQVEQSDHDLNETSNYPTHTSAFSLQGSQQREQSYNQLRPERISLTPASRAQHVLHRWTQPSGEQHMSASDDGMPQVQGMRSSEVVRVNGNGGRSQDAGGNGVRSSSRVATSGGGTGGKLKQHLSNFAYTPTASRASQRPSPASAAPPPESTNVFRYNVPPLQAPSHHQQIEQSPNGFQYPEDDRRAMPPPPVPSTSTSSRRAPTTTQQQRNTHSFPPPSVQSQSQSQSAPSRARPLFSTSSSRQSVPASFSNRAETPRPQSTSIRFGQPGEGGGGGSSQNPPTQPFRPRSGL